MGNCLQSSGAASGGEGLVQGRRRGRRRRRRDDGDEEEEEEEGGAASPVLKVKMVLTKTELEWLMAQLKSGDRRLEDVLRDMARKRDVDARAGWRPSLESIVECPAETSPAAAAAAVVSG